MYIGSIAWHRVQLRAAGRCIRQVLALAIAITLQHQQLGAHPWFMGRWLPAPMARPALERSRSVTNAFAARTACIGAAPFASSAAIADASVQPVPCVFPVLH